MYLTKEDVTKKEKYLKLNQKGEFVIDYPEKLNIIDFHTHLSNLIPLKSVDPNTKGNAIEYPTLPPLKKMDLHTPYWTAPDAEAKNKGIISLLRFSIEGMKILKAMVNGGTYENCFRSQKDNMISKNVLLPLSNKKSDFSPQAFEVAKEHPDRFAWFCSVHPFDPQMKQKVFKYKDLGAKGLKLKITDMELKNKIDRLVDLLKACHEAKLPVLFHTGSLTKINQKNTSKLMWKLLKSTRVEIFGELLKQLPNDFIFVFGHSGIQEYELVAKYMKNFPATYAEVSCQSAESIKYLIEHVGSERVIFGSDWPALPQAFTLSRVLVATEDDHAARANILYENAKRLLAN